MIDWDELKRLYAPCIVPDVNRKSARATFEEYMHDAFPHILAERTALLAKLAEAESALAFLDQHSCATGAARATMTCHIHFEYPDHENDDFMSAIKAARK